MEDLLQFLFDLLSVKRRKRGPLAARVDFHGPQGRLTLENKGKRKLAFAAVRCHDGHGEQHFPQVDLAPGTVLRPGRPQTVTIASSHRDCRRLVILDTTGHAWPVEGVDAEGDSGPR